MKKLSAIFVLVVFSLMTPSVMAYNTQYWKVYDLENTNMALYDYVIPVIVDTYTEITHGKMRQDCRDVVFMTEKNVLDYWMESGCGTSQTLFWVRFNEIPSGSSSFFLHYGDPNLIYPTTTDIFTVYDDFKGDLSGNWTIKKNQGPLTSQITYNDNLFLSLTGTCSLNGTSVAGILGIHNDIHNDLGWSLRSRIKASVGGGSLMIGGWESSDLCKQGTQQNTCAYTSYNQNTLWLGSIIDDGSMISIFNGSYPLSSDWHIIETGISNQLSTYVDGSMLAAGQITLQHPLMGGILIESECQANETHSVNAEIDWVHVRPLIYPEPIATLDPDQPVCGNDICEEWETHESCQYDCRYMSVPNQIEESVYGGSRYWTPIPIQRTQRNHNTKNSRMNLDANAVNIYVNGQFQTQTGHLSFSSSELISGHTRRITATSYELFGCWKRTDGLFCDYSGSVITQTMPGTTFAKGTYSRESDKTLRLFIPNNGMTRLTIFNSDMSLWSQFEL